MILGMPDSDISPIKVLIKPQFDAAHHVASLSISLTIEEPKLEWNNVLVSFPGLVEPLTRIDEVSIKALNGDGLLPLSLGGNTVSWTVGRRTSNDVEISYEVSPLASNVAGSPLDLQFDHGGVPGSGLSFIPVPRTDQIYRNIVEWDLGQTTEGMRAVWTFGEGPRPVCVLGPASILSEPVYIL